MRPPLPLPLYARRRAQALAEARPTVGAGLGARRRRGERASVPGPAVTGTTRKRSLRYLYACRPTPDNAVGPMQWACAESDRRGLVAELAALVGAGPAKLGTSERAEAAQTKQHPLRSEGVLDADQPNTTERRDQGRRDDDARRRGCVQR